MPKHLAPMLARAGQLPTDDEDWAFEIKWDGLRAIAYRRPGELRIENRNRRQVTALYPELQALGDQLGEHELVLDGEIVAFDEHGSPDFERLQRRMHLTSESAISRLARQAPVTYVIFDLLYLDGQPTVDLPYRERRRLLESMKLNGPNWQTPVAHLADGAAFLRATAERGLEGVLAKRLRSTYRPGERTGDWLKIKNTARQELVIGGWLVGKGARAGRIGALLVGYHEGGGSQRMLRYAGRVGSGFKDAELESLGAELAARARRSSPFAVRGPQPPRGACFVEPELVAEIEFSHWTRERLLRQSSYKGLRGDKPAGEVELEPDDKRPPAPARRRASSKQELPGRSPPYVQLHATKRDIEIEARGRRLRLSNREKVFYPSLGFTKGQMIDYYAAIAPALLPHLAGRPLTLKRYPNGVERPFFYEKRCPAHRPDWVQTAALWSERRQEQIDYCLVEDLPTLLWVANLANVELHPSLSMAHDIDTPTALVFDLDPGPPAGLRECCRVALLIRELFEALGLQTVAKTSGSKGMQVYLPLNTPTSYEQTKPLARAVAELLEREHPKLVVSRMTMGLRHGRVLVDWSQNDPHKTTICVYSLRARERPTISTPLDWEEVERGSRRRSEPQLSLEPRELLRRIERHGARFIELLVLTQRLPALADSGQARTRARLSTRRAAS